MINIIANARTNRKDDIFVQRRLYIDEAHTVLDIFRFAVFFNIQNYNLVYTSILNRFRVEGVYIIISNLLRFNPGHNRKQAFFSSPAGQLSPSYISILWIQNFSSISNYVNSLNINYCP